MRISQVFILSPRGDKIVFKDYRQDVPRNADEIFFRKVKFWDGDQHQAVAGDCPPMFMEKGIFFYFVRKNGLLFVAASRAWNISPALMVESISRTCKVLKDFLGVLSEDAVRKNFTLVYELLDEMIDNGAVQELSSERLRPYIFNEPIKGEEVELPKEDGMLTRIRKGDFLERTRKSNATNMSILQGSKDRKNEIYIDIIERLNVVFNASGGIVTSEVDGSIIMKSFLAGSPDLYLGLNEDLVVGRDSRAKFASVNLDSVNFHESADHTRFESERMLMMRPPDGEFVVMNYRMVGDKFTQPFRVMPSLELVSTYKAELTLRVRGDVPPATSGINVAIRCPVPKATTSVSVELGVGAGSAGQKYDYKQDAKQVTWVIPKFKGGTEHVCKIGIASSAPFTPALRKEIGPITMNFEVPNHNVTGIAIKFMRLEERSQSYNPQRWVRNITQAASYVTRTS